jgi:hypothetical protein
MKGSNLALIIIGTGLFINFITSLLIEKYRYPHWYIHFYAIISCMACITFMWFILFSSGLVYQGFGT